MRIQHNIAAMYINRQMRITKKTAVRNMERLSSGYCINRAADDAAGLAISEKMRSQIRGLQKGSQNVQEGISFCNVAEGALNEVHNILGRVKELAVQAASDTYVLEDRQAIEAEFTQLKKEINRISRTTEFNTMRIFDDGQFKIEFSDDICPIKIFNANHGDPADPDTYGGIIVADDVRIAWKTIDPNMVTTDPDTGETVFKAGEYKYETPEYNFTITCEEGSKPPEIKVEFEVSANGEGIKIAGSTIRWEDVVNEDEECILDHLGEEGTYHFRNREGEGGFYVEEGAMLSDIIWGLNKYNEKTHKRYFNIYDGYYTEQAVTVGDCGSKVQITQDIYESYIKVNAPVDLEIKIQADEDAVWTVDANGNILADSRKTWAELGLEYWDSTNDVSDSKVYEYIYNSADGKVNVEFGMFLLDETSKQSVIEGINEMPLLDGGYLANNETTLTVDTNGNVTSGKLTYVNNEISVEEEGKLGRDFNVQTGEITSTIPTYRMDLNEFYVQFVGPEGDTLQYDAVSVTDKATIKTVAEGLPTQYLIARAVQSLMNGFGTISHATIADVVGYGNITTTGHMTETFKPDEFTVKTEDLKDETYPAASIDFSGLGGSYQLYDLLGTGFDSTCMTCTNHYSVMFTYGNATNTTSSGYGYSIIEDSNNNYTMNIDLQFMLEQGVTNGADFAKAIVEVLDEGDFDFHFNQYAADDSGKFYICDNRPGYVGTDMIYDGSFYVEPYQAGQVVIDMELQNNDRLHRSMEVQYRYDIFSKLAIEAVAEQDDAAGMYVKNAAGQWEVYDASKYYDANGNLISGVTVPTRYNIKVENRNDILDWEKIYDDIMMEIVDSSTYAIVATDYAFCNCWTAENPNEAYVSTFRFQTEEDKDDGMWIQAGPNQFQGMYMKWDGFSAHYLGLDYLSMTDREEASKLIRRADKAIEKISGIRSAFGAYTNRLEKMYDMNQNYAENLQTAESKLRDADMAQELVQLSKNNILQQIGQSILVQANQSKQGILTLLQS